MDVEWTVPALKRISQIKSKYFSPEETDEYRIELVNRINNKILRTGNVIKLRRRTKYQEQEQVIEKIARSFFCRKKKKRT
jgi:CHASE3 domain sensor protein